MFDLPVDIVTASLISFPPSSRIRIVPISSFLEVSDRDNFTRRSFVQSVRLSSFSSTWSLQHSICTATSKDTPYATKLIYTNKKVTWIRTHDDRVHIDICDLNRNCLRQQFLSSFGWPPTFLNINSKTIVVWYFTANGQGTWRHEKKEIVNSSEFEPGGVRLEAISKFAATTSAQKQTNAYLSKGNKAGSR